MMEHDETSNLLDAKSHDHFKRTSESIGHIWNNLTKRKGNKKKAINDGEISVETTNNNVMTNINVTSLKIPKMIHQNQEIVCHANSESKSIMEKMNLYNADVAADNKSDVKSCDNIILKNECQLRDGTANLCQSETRLINQGPYITPKKLVKRSKIPQKRIKYSDQPNIFQYYSRSVQSVNTPITELLPEMENIPVKKINIEKIRCDKDENELSPDINEISNDREMLSISHQSSKNSSLDFSVSTNSPKFETNSLNLNHFETLKKGDLSEDISAWYENETSETDSNSPTQRKVLYRQPFRIAHSTTMSSSNFTVKSLSKSVCSEYERYKFSDALLDLICWPFLFLQREEE